MNHVHGCTTMKQGTSAYCGYPLTVLQTPVSLLSLKNVVLTVELGEAVSFKSDVGDAFDLFCDAGDAGDAFDLFCDVSDAFDLFCLKLASKSSPIEISILVLRLATTGVVDEGRDDSGADVGND